MFLQQKQFLDSTNTTTNNFVSQGYELYSENKLMQL